MSYFKPAKGNLGPNLIEKNPAENPAEIPCTDLPAYNDTAYSDTPLIVTLWTGPKSFINRIDGYGDTNIWLE